MAARDLSTREAVRTRPKAATKSARSAKAGKDAKERSDSSRAKKPTKSSAAGWVAGSSTDARVREALDWLERKSTARDLANLERFGITAKSALGVAMVNVQALAKRLGRDHELAAALWATDCYEARLLSAFVDDPGRVSVAQMNAWCREFDNWAVCDTLCFHLFDRTPHAFGRVDAWCGTRAEFSKRAGFALLASLAGHHPTAPDSAFTRGLALVEREATDPRNFVKKAVSWALRRIGWRNVPLNRAASALAKRLAASADPVARATGKAAYKELASEKLQKRLATRAKTAR